MSLTVSDRSGAVATFRFVAVFLMESLARWVPTTAEMELKVLFGQHIWDLAQLADALGRRTHELRLPAQHSQRPTGDYVRMLEQLAGVEPSPDRLAAMYEVALPGLSERFRRYLAETDALMDAPTVRILERANGDIERICAEARQLREELAGLAAPDPRLVESLRGAESGVAAIVVVHERSAPTAG
jgi:hypothetical protein